MVANRLAELRKSRGVTQSHLAERLGVSRQTIVSIENGRFTASLPLAFKVANYFSCQIEDVFFYDEGSSK